MTAVSSQSRSYAKKTEMVGWSNIVEVDGIIKYNRDCQNIWSLYITPTINLGEKETVAIMEEIFRADLNAIVLHTDKILSNTEVNKEESEKQLAELIKEYNKQEIESDEQMMAYCRINGLKPEDVDVDELRKVLKNQSKNLDLPSFQIGVISDICLYPNRNQRIFNNEYRNKYRY